MVRRFADAETISATGAFLVGELERLDSRIYEPIADFTYGRDIDLRNDVTIADEVSSFIQSEYMGGFGGTGTGKKSFIKGPDSTPARVSVSLKKVATLGHGSRLHDFRAAEGHAGRSPDRCAETLCYAHEASARH